LDIFTQSKIRKIALQKIKAEKLVLPSKDSALKIGIGVGLYFDDKKKDLGYEVTYNLTISCEENKKEKLCKLDYSTKVTYEIAGKSEEIEDQFRKEHVSFVRELYNMTRDELNDILYKMKVRLQLPLSLPEEFILNMEEVEDE